LATPLIPSGVPEPRPAEPAAKARRLVERAKAQVLARPNRAALFGAGAALVSLVLMFAQHHAGLGRGAGIDYQVYRWAVRTWLDGGDLTAGAPLTSAERVLPWVYPPFALVPLAVPALLPFTAGLWLLYLADLAALGGVLFLVARRVWPDCGRAGARAVALWALAGALWLEPVYASFGLGQVNILLMALVAVDCLVEQPRWPRGLLVGLAAAIKLTPLAFLLLFVVRRQHRAALVALGTAVAGTAVGFVISRASSVDYWFGRGPAAGVSGSAFHTNQSIMGELARLQLPPVPRYAVWLVLAVLLVLVTAQIVGRAPLSAAVPANGLLALLISPTSWSDHWVWVAPGVLVAAAAALRGRSRGWAVSAVVLVVVALNATFRMLPAGGHWNALQHLVGNSYLLTGIAMLLLLARDARRGGTGSGAAEPILRH